MPSIDMISNASNIEAPTDNATNLLHKDLVFLLLSQL